MVNPTLVFPPPQRGPQPIGETTSPRSLTNDHPSGSGRSRNFCFRARILALGLCGVSPRLHSSNGIGYYHLSNSPAALGKGPVHKGRSQSEGCPVRTFCGQGRFFRYGRPHFLVQKTSNFSKFMLCPHGQGGKGMSQCGQEGRGSIFCDFVRTSCMDAPNVTMLISQTYAKKKKKKTSTLLVNKHTLRRLRSAALV